MKRGWKTYRLFLVGWLVFITNPFQAFSQIEDITAPEESLQEGLFSSDDEQISTGTFEAYDQYLKNPLDLNSATADELALLYILSEEQIQHFLDYKKYQGLLLSIYELQAIKGFDSSTIKRLLPYVEVDTRKALGYKDPFLKRLTKPDKHFIIVRYSQSLNLPTGFFQQDSTPKIYAGSPARTYFRYQLRRAGDYSFGLTLDKDPGERFLLKEGKDKGLPDFYSFHAGIYNRGKIKSFIVGDYQFQSGQGLLFTSGFHLGSNEPVKAVNRYSTGISPFTSAMETGFFRGVAITLQPLNKLFFSTFYSNRKLDAGLETNEEGKLIAVSLPTNGLHRKESEYQKKKVFGEQVFGADLRYKNGPFELGSSMVKTHFEHPIQLPLKDYNLFNFRGKELLAASGYYKFRWQNFSFFGEVATSGKDGFGFINGFSTKLAPEVSMSFVHRSYSKEFTSLYGGAFGENTRNNNESGVFIGLKAKPVKGWELAAFFDKYRFPWLKFRVDAPSGGEGAMLRVKHKPKGWLMWYAQINYRSKGLNFRADSLNIDLVKQTKFVQYRLNADYTANQYLKMRSRLQMSKFTHGASSMGTTLFQDFSYAREKWSLGTRFAIFDTDFDTRQYVYEKDVLYSFSVPAYSGKGTRSYLIFHWELTHNIDFWGRFAITHYTEQYEKGTGADAIEGNIHPDVKFQVKVKL
ncbi:helix-hairpin-helix domain-containing protein [Flammeovirgaceae bacterium SG7u.111]|nr:helix-hairpin-helix domain-containing protein [Flammeovirgaceae bacterium SG7u.132]WPO33410.1 helix-hairpin-helix domain-containing protein [Flammeovirgaceae bacterium SG7u.111]